MLRTAWLWALTKEMLSLNRHLPGHCFQLGNQARTRAPGVRDLDRFMPEYDWNRGRDVWGRGRQMPPARREQPLSACRAPPRGAAASAPGLC